MTLIALVVCASSMSAQPNPSPGRAGVQRDGRLTPLPLTQLDERALAIELDSRTFTLTFSQPLAVRDLLLLLVRGTALSVVPDPSIGGSFIGELKNVTVRQALALVLQPLGFDFAVDGSFIRVFRRQPESRMFEINYVATSRVGTSSVGGRSDRGSFARVAGTTDANVFDDIAHTVQGLLTPGAPFSVDRKAGLLHVTDFPERLDRVAAYLDAVHDRVHRQVQVEARVVAVELSDPSSGLDWDALAQAVGDVRPGRSLTNGLRVRDVGAFMTALRAQGLVSVLATPRVLVLDNEPAVMRTAISPSSVPGGKPADGAVEFALGVTPRIEGDGAVMLSVTPILETARWSDGGGATPAPAVQEIDTLARIGNGETVVLGALTGAGRSAAGPDGGIRLFGRPRTTGTGGRTEVLFLLSARVTAGVGTR